MVMDRVRPHILREEIWLLWSTHREADRGERIATDLESLGGPDEWASSDGGLPGLIEKEQEMVVPLQTQKMDPRHEVGKAFT